MGYGCQAYLSAKDKSLIFNVHDLLGLQPDSANAMSAVLQIDANIDDDAKAFIIKNGVRVNARKCYGTDKESGNFTGWLPFTVATNSSANPAMFILSLDDFSFDDDIPDNMQFTATITATAGGRTDTIALTIHLLTGKDNMTSAYKKEANQIGDKMQSFLLIRTNPKLTGNIKLVIGSDYQMYLDTLKVSTTSALNERQYRHQKVSADGNYPRDVKAVFNGLPTGTLFNVHDESYEPHRNYYDIYQQVDDTYEYGARTNSDSLYPENMAIFAPLFIGKSIPDYFCVFRTDRVVNNETYSSQTFKDIDKFEEILNEAKVVKIFDLRNHTAAGHYLRRYCDMSDEYLAGTCYLQFIEREFGSTELEYNRQGVNTWKGISVDKGIFVNKQETTYFAEKAMQQGQESFNMFMLNGFARNNILYPNILNLEFMFDDDSQDEFSMHNYFGLYLSENQFNSIEYAVMEDDGVNRRMKYSVDGSVVNEQAVSMFSIVDNPTYYDHLFFISTDNDAQYLYTSADAVQFMRQYVCNVPKQSICHLKAAERSMSGVDCFITMKFDRPIRYGEHFRIVMLDVRHETGETKNVVLDMVMSSDSRLANAKDCVGPYVMTTTPAEWYGDTQTEIYSIPVYTQNQYSNSVTATISDQLKRLRAALSRFKTYVYVGSCSEDAISIIVRKVSEYDVLDSNLSGIPVINDVYLEHVLSTAHSEFDEEYVKYTHYDAVSAYSDSTNVFVLPHDVSTYSVATTPFALCGYELTGDRSCYAVKFFDPDNYSGYYFYEMPTSADAAIQKCVKPLVNTVKGYFPLVSLCTMSGFVADGLLQTDTHYEGCVITSPFDVNKSLVCSPFKAKLSNYYLNICEPTGAAISLMGIHSVKDLNMYVGISETHTFSTESAKFVSAGTDMYVTGASALLKYFVIYKLKSGCIRKLPAGSGVKFMLVPGKIYYVFNGNVESTPFFGNYLTADTDVELAVASDSMFDLYDYTTADPVFNQKNFFADSSNTKTSDLTIPMVPPVVCQWRSNGVYFDHQSLLNVDYAPAVGEDDYKAVGNFVENSYALAAGEDQFIPNGLDTMITVDNVQMSLADYMKSAARGKYPVKKSLIQRYIPETAVGYYNKHVQTLEFIYYGIKFIVRFSDTDYSNDIKLEQYNNYQVFMLNDYTGSVANEMYVSVEEEYILIINHCYRSVGDESNTQMAIQTGSDLVEASYAYRQAPYEMEVFNTGSLGQYWYFFGKNDEYYVTAGDGDGTSGELTGVKYVLQIGVNTYDDYQVPTVVEQPYFIYINTQQVDGADVYKAYSGYDAVKQCAETEYPIMLENYGNDTTSIMAYSDNGADNNTILRYFDGQTINHLVKYMWLIYDTTGNGESTDDGDVFKQRMSAYVDSFTGKQLKVYIMKSGEEATELLINDDYRPIYFDLSIPNRIKYNNGLFDPQFEDIFEFNINDGISDELGMDCLLGNTSISGINTVKNYMCNKVMLKNSANGGKQPVCTYNFFNSGDRSVLMTSWDSGIYRLYTSDTKYTDLAGYMTGIEDSTFFGSKCMVLKSDYITVDSWTSNIQSSVEIMKYNVNDNAQQAFMVRLNITKAFDQTLLDTSGFSDNWSVNLKNYTDAESAMNNYLKKTMHSIYKLQSPDLVVYSLRKNGQNAQALDVAPADLQSYEECQGFQSEYETVNDEVILKMYFTDYTNMSYYPVVKIYRH